MTTTDVLAELCAASARKRVLLAEDDLTDRVLRLEATVRLLLAAVYKLDQGMMSVSEAYNDDPQGCDLLCGLNQHAKAFTDLEAGDLAAVVAAEAAPSE